MKFKEFKAAYSGSYYLPILKDGKQINIYPSENEFNNYYVVDWKYNPINGMYGVILCKRKKMR